MISLVPQSDYNSIDNTYIKNMLELYQLVPEEIKKETLFNIKNCYCITDVSILKDVYLLDIGGCEGLTDISMLTGVKELYMWKGEYPKDQIDKLKKHGVNINYYVLTEDEAFLELL